MSNTTAEQNPNMAPPDETSKSLMQYVYIGMAVLVGIFLIIFVLAVVLSTLYGDAQFGQVVAVIRDVIFIFLALEGILIILALTVLIAQIARLVNLIQNEIKPILHNTQETVQHAKGTVEFVGKNLTEPIMTVNKFAAAGGVFARELFRLRRTLRSRDVDESVEGNTEHAAS